MTLRAPEPMPSVIQSLYAQQEVLRIAYPAYSFALDGNLIGDIGEAIAQIFFGLEKLPGNSQQHDMKRPEDGLLVQVKTTQKAANSKPVGLGLVKRTFDCLLVLELERDGSFEVLYNGPGSVIDEKRQNKTSSSLSRLQLRECQKLVSDEHRLKPITGVSDFTMYPSA
jgi:hypothetical protein